MTQVGQVSVGLGLDDAKFKKGIKDAEKQTLQFANVMKKALAGLSIGVAINTIVKGIKTSVQAFREQEIAAKSLNTALMNSGVYSAEYSQHLQNLASELQAVSNFGDEATMQAIAVGQAMVGNIQITDELIRATADFASATGMDLQNAFNLVGKAIGTQTNALGRYGVALDQNMTKEQKMAEVTRVLSQRYTGQAQQMANASVQLQNAVGDLAEEIGGVFNPAVEAAQKLLAQWAREAGTAIKNVRVATTDINKLTLAEAQLRLEQANSGASFTKNWKINKDYVKSIEDRIAVLKKEEAVKESMSKKNTSNVAAPTDTKALDEYKKFVEEFQQATNEYNATLKARNYVEKTLGTTAFALDADYNGLVETYKNYYAKRSEIEQSNALNKAQLLKQNETKLQQDLQTIDINFTNSTAQKTYEIMKSMQSEKIKLLNDEQAYQNAGGFLASFSSTFEKRLEIEKNYLAQREEIRKTHYNNALERQDAFNELELLKTQQYAQLETDAWRQRGHDIESILNSSFSTMLTNYGDFADNMKQLVLNLVNYAIKELMQLLISSKTVKTALSGFGGGIFSFLGFHSGGTILPTGSKHHYGGTQLPQTDQTEHFALLKNNERVLSPSETSAYNQGQGNSQPNYIVYAPQVRAMDSRDVAGWFNDNKQQIISIVSQGIKNNNQGLRTQIQGV